MFDFNKVQPLPAPPVLTNAQKASNWLGKHKVELIGAAITVAIATIAAVSIVATGGTSTLMYGAILGGILGCGAIITTASGVTSHGLDRLKEEAEKQKKMKKPAPSLFSRVWAGMTSKKAVVSLAICTGALVATGIAYKGYQIYTA